jgi:hypothetical protein
MGPPVRGISNAIRKYGLSLAVIVGVCAGETAAPALAENAVPQGIYHYDSGDKPPADWTIYPICVPTVGDLREPLSLPVSCTLNITPAGRMGVKAVMKNGLWTATMRNEEGLRCPDGSAAPTNEVYAFDGTTLTGTLTTLNVDVCGVAASLQEQPFNLTFKQPLPIPVNQYPLTCEPGGLRRCS